MPIILDTLMLDIEKLGYTVETFTNEVGNRFTFRLWKDHKLVTDVNAGTWVDLEPMYDFVLHTYIPTLLPMEQV